MHCSAYRAVPERAVGGFPQEGRDPSLRAGKGWEGRRAHIAAYVVTLLHVANWAKEEIQYQEVPRA